MLITTKKVNVNPVILLDNETVPRVNSYKYLGVFMDDSLKYHDHIDYIHSRLSRLCGISYRLKDHICFNSAKSFYYSCVYSILTYCICVWGGILQCTSRGDRLKSLHKKILKNLFCLDDREGCVFKKFGILKLTDIHRLYVCMYMYKVIKLNMCPTLQFNLDLSYPAHAYSTRCSNDLVLPFPRVEAIRLNFKYQCVKLWNGVPESIKSLTSLRRFKKTLISTMLNEY